MQQTKRTIKNEQLIYDVGMHKGEDTAFYLKKGFKVIAFEADPDLVSLCKQKFTQAINDGNLTIVEGAIVEAPSDASQTVRFYKNTDNSVWGTVDEQWAKRNELLGTKNQILEIPAVNFTACLEKYGIPHYLKIDVEGMDIVCLKALTNFEHKPSYLSIESEKILLSKLIDEFSLLTSLGYTNFKAIQQCGISSQREPNPAREGSYVNHQFQEGSSGLFGEDLPGSWMDYKQILDRYGDIFVTYKIYGDYGIKKYALGRLATKIASKILHKPIPGWYDTHAKHFSTL